MFAQIFREITNRSLNIGVKAIINLRLHYVEYYLVLDIVGCIEWFEMKSDIDKLITLRMYAQLKEGF